VKITICYFTCTDNLFAAVKKIAKFLSGWELVPITLLKFPYGDDAPLAKRVGIVFLVYEAGLPRVVNGFTGQVRFSGFCSAFANTPVQSGCLRNSTMM